MAIMLPDGQGAALPMPAKRPRGRSLSAASVRRLRDLLCFLLVRVVGLSPEDTVRVMQPVHKDTLTRRLRQIPIKPQQALAALLQAGGAQNAA